MKKLKPLVYFFILANLIILFGQNDVKPYNLMYAIWTGILLGLFLLVEGPKMIHGYMIIGGLFLLLFFYDVIPSPFSWLSSHHSALMPSIVLTALFVFLVTSAWMWLVRLSSGVIGENVKADE